MKKKLCTIKVHSIVDVITNSSTELFCVVKGNTESEVRKIINKILHECECSILIDSIDVYPHEDWENDDGKVIEGQFDILYEQHAPPCGMILRKIKEVFEVIYEE